jgi:hypothetical protein
MGGGEIFLLYKNNLLSIFAATNLAVTKEEDTDQVQQTVDLSKTRATIDVCTVNPSAGRPCQMGETGPDTNLFYYYSHVENRCKVFFYHGCDGNRNRFTTRNECMMQCTVGVTFLKFYTDLLCKLISGSNITCRHVYDICHSVPVRSDASHANYAR